MFARPRLPGLDASQGIVQPVAPRKLVVAQALEGVEFIPCSGSTEGSDRRARH